MNIDDDHSRWHANGMARGLQAGGIERKHATGCSMPKTGPTYLVEKGERLLVRCLQVLCICGDRPSCRSCMIASITTNEPQLIDTQSRQQQPSARRPGRQRCAPMNWKMGPIGRKNGGLLVPRMLPLVV